ECCSSLKLLSHIRMCSEPGTQCLFLEVIAQFAGPRQKAVRANIMTRDLARFRIDLFDVLVQKTIQFCARVCIDVDCFSTRAKRRRLSQGRKAKSLNLIGLRNNHWLRRRTSRGDLRWRGDDEEPQDRKSGGDRISDNYHGLLH